MVLWLSQWRERMDCQTYQEEIIVLLIVQLILLSWVEISLPKDQPEGQIKDKNHKVKDVRLRSGNNMTLQCLLYFPWGGEGGGICIPPNTNRVKVPFSSTAMYYYLECIMNKYLNIACFWGVHKNIVIFDIWSNRYFFKKKRRRNLMLMPATELTNQGSALLVTNIVLQILYSKREVH